MSQDNMYVKAQDLRSNEIITLRSKQLLDLSTRSRKGIRVKKCVPFKPSDKYNFKKRSPYGRLIGGKMHKYYILGMEATEELLELTTIKQLPNNCNETPLEDLTDYSYNPEEINNMDDVTANTIATNQRSEAVVKGVDLQNQGASSSADSNLNLGEKSLDPFQQGNATEATENEDHVPVNNRKEELQNTDDVDMEKESKTPKSDESAEDIQSHVHTTCGCSVCVHKLNKIGEKFLSSCLLDNAMDISANENQKLVALVNNGKEKIQHTDDVKMETERKTPKSDESAEDLQSQVHTASSSLVCVQKLDKIGEIQLMDVNGEAENKTPLSEDTTDTTNSRTGDIPNIHGGDVQLQPQMQVLIDHIDKMLINVRDEIIRHIYIASAGIAIEPNKSSSTLEPTAVGSIQSLVSAASAQPSTSMCTRPMTYSVIDQGVKFEIQAVEAFEIMKDSISDNQKLIKLTNLLLGEDQLKGYAISSLKIKSNPTLKLFSPKFSQLLADIYNDFSKQCASTNGDNTRNVSQIDVTPADINKILKKIMHKCRNSS